MNSPTEQLREAIRYLLSNVEGKSQADMARKTGVNKSYINDFLAGRAPGKEKSRVAWSSYFGRTYPELLAFGQYLIEGGSPKDYQWSVFGNVEGAIPPVKGAFTVTVHRKVPLISWVQAGIWTEVLDEFQPGDADEWVPVFKNVSEGTFALKIAGDSMSPEFQPGETIVVDPDVLPENGSFVVAKVENGNNENGEATFKQFVRDGTHIYLKPLNDRYNMLDVTGKDFKIVGCVVQKVKEY